MPATATGRGAQVLVDPTDGAAGARLYVSQGGGTWIAIAAV
jgi:hypothetical protein